MFTFPRFQIKKKFIFRQINTTETLIIARLQWWKELGNNNKQQNRSLTVAFSVTIICLFASSPPHMCSGLKAWQLDHWASLSFLHLPEGPFPLTLLFLSPHFCLFLFFLPPLGPQEAGPLAPGLAALSHVLLPLVRPMAASARALIRWLNRKMETDLPA